MNSWGAIVCLVAFAGVQVFAEDLAFPENARGLSSSRIVSGWEAREGQIPWQLSLRMVNSVGSVSSCGGSIIHPQWGLTAAHCTATRVTMVLRAGAVSLLRPELLFETFEYFNHPLYIDALQNIVQPHDISILKFSAPLLSLVIRVQPIRIQRSEEKNRNYQGVRLVASGWGRTWTNGATPENLQWVYLLGDSNQVCRSAFGQSSIIVDSTICASAYNVTSQSTCQGDSGGPLVELEEDGKYTLVGVTSFVSSSGCHTPLPAGFIRPGHYHDWIKRVTGIKFDWVPEEESSEESSQEKSSQEKSSEESSSQESSSQEKSSQENSSQKKSSEESSSQEKSSQEKSSQEKSSSESSSSESSSQEKSSQEKSSSESSSQEKPSQEKSSQEKSSSESSSSESSSQEKPSQEKSSQEKSSSESSSQEKPSQEKSSQEKSSSESSSQEKSSQEKSSQEKSSSESSSQEKSSQEKSSQEKSSSESSSQEKPSQEKSSQEKSSSESSSQEKPSQEKSSSESSSQEKSSQEKSSQEKSSSDSSSSESSSQEKSSQEKSSSDSSSSESSSQERSSEKSHQEKSNKEETSEDEQSRLFFSFFRHDFGHV